MSKKDKIIPVGLIYKIESADGTLVYIGSTSKNLNTRVIEHKSSYKRFLAGKTNYCCSYEILKNAGYNASIIETHLNTSQSLLRTREGELQQTMDCVNKQIAGRNKTDWIEDNKQHLKDYKKKWYKDSAARLKQRINCNCGGKYTQHSISTHEKTKKHTQYMKLQQQITDLQNQFKKVLVELKTKPMKITVVNNTGTININN
jgi:hypothetical protein